MTTRSSTSPKPLRKTLAAVVAALALAPLAGAAAKKADRPLRALLITGGCCHDYQSRKKIVSEGVSARANVEWTIVHEGGSSTKHKVSIYDVPGWADTFDVVVHDECFADISEQDFVEKVLAPHRQGTPAVVIHCAMHTFRSLKTDAWREFLGVTTRSHGPRHPLEVKDLKPDHPIMRGFPSVWTTGNEELYAILKVWRNAEPLAQAHALDNKKDHAVIWTNTYGQGRVFGTTLAHNNVTMSDPVYLDMLTRGLLWSCDKLDEDGKPKSGYEIPSRQ